MERAIRPAIGSARRARRARGERRRGASARNGSRRRPPRAPPADEFDALVPGETQTVAVRDVVVGDPDADACAVEDLVTRVRGPRAHDGEGLPAAVHADRAAGAQARAGLGGRHPQGSADARGGERLIRVPTALGFKHGRVRQPVGHEGEPLSDDDSRRAVPKYADLEFECKLLKVERGLLADLVDLLGFGFNLRTCFLLASVAIVTYVDLVAPSRGGGPAQ